ncbi:uncharacterized protein F5891DRAFT_961130 [Suillus fuscotomentosus]|uniref:Uncharacterized protein n=1 Tax=Suillus fuscotomentosus TaxID=1912939 RepID=A0AAD4DVG2_9AGAM|nr:uncharacterized protein F5891DRAFT_961130 [Suillus fuscotomentosus]KAG1894760.1 hypothetical protein F5891DRAFT_961130 [Suillus fuscotomentosus]
MSQSSLHDSIHTDPNSPEVLKQNVQIALDHVARIQSLARNCLHGIQSAYQAGNSNSPAHTTGKYLAALMQALRTIAEFLRQTGVGAYPMPPAPESQSASSVPPTEQQLIDTTAREVQVLYERLKRIQESNTVAVNLLGAADTVSRAR